MSFMLSVANKSIMLSAAMLNVVMLNAVMLNVVAPRKRVAKRLYGLIL